MAEEPQLARLYLLHLDGYMREAALNALCPPLDPLSTYLLCLCMNDWVPQVRAAAEQAFARCAPDTPAANMLPVLWQVMRVGQSWQRWENRYASLLDEISVLPDLLAAVVAQLRDGAAPGSTQILRAISRSPAIDAALPDLAQHARQPYLRTLALDFLIKGRAEWPTGQKRKIWRNKPLGIATLVPETAQRPLTCQPALPALLAAGLADRSVKVRKYALDGLIQHRDRPDLRHLIDAQISQRDQAQYAGLRMRLDYLAARMAEQRPS